jgi:hypothetical protein
MQEVVCHIGSYNVWEAFKLTWALLVLNGLTIGGIGALLMLFFRK